MVADRLVLALLVSGTSLLVGVAGYALRALARSSHRLRSAHETLEARLSELATLQALGRDLMATNDPERLFAILERECRKVLPADHVALGIVDHDAGEMRVTERGSDDLAPRLSGHPLGAGTVWPVLREKRAMALPPGDAAEGAMKSLAAAPLLVGDRAVGVLSVGSRRPDAYDSHHLAILAAIAQHVAAAAETVRRDHRASTDAVTGLGLRESFARRLEEEHARAKRYRGRFVVLMIDLDGFRELNDRHGFHGGDRFLRAVGAAIRSQLRRTDLAARFGADEICVLLPETDLARGRVIAERMRAAIAQIVVTVDGAALRGTVSIGVAAHPEHGEGESKTLLLRADQALYQAKREGRDRVAAYAPRP